MIEHGYSGTRAYGQSKLAQITTGFELAERLDPKEVTVASLHPSTYMPTKMVLEEIGRSVDRLEDGVAATVRLALDPELEGVTGTSTTARPSPPPTRRPTTARPAAGSGSSRSKLTGEREPAF